MPQGVTECLGCSRVPASWRPIREHSFCFFRKSCRVRACPVVRNIFLSYRPQLRLVVCPLRKVHETRGRLPPRTRVHAGSGKLLDCSDLKTHVGGRVQHSNVRPALLYIYGGCDARRQGKRRAGRLTAQLRVPNPGAAPLPT